MAITHLYNDNFELEIGQTEGLALVDFWATWCGPCRMIAPAIETIADELDGTLDVFKLDVDEGDEIAAKYGVMSIPTVIFFKNGKEVDRVVGYRSYDDLMEIIKKNQ